MLNSSNSNSAVKLRILGVDPEVSFAGGETQVLGLTGELMHRGHQAELLCDPSGELSRRATIAGIRCHPLTIRNALDIRAGLRLRRLLATEPFDVVHFHTSRAHAMAPFARGHAPSLVVTRRMDYTLRGIFSPWLYNRAVDSVAAISQSVAKALVSSGVASDRITLIPSGVDVDLFCPPTHEQREQARQALGINADEIVIVAVGMLEPRKGHRYLLDAIAAISQSASPESKTPAGKARLKLMIAGAGSQFHSLGDHVQQLGISALVNLLGLLPDPRPMLAAADIFVQPSLKEGLGVSILEAMATGLPIAATTAGGIAEVLDEEITGILVPPADAVSMATALSRLIASRELRTELGSAARIRAVRDYSMATMAERTIAFYQTSLARHSNQKRGTACAA